MLPAHQLPELHRVPRTLTPTPAPTLTLTLTPTPTATLTPTQAPTPSRNPNRNPTPSLALTVPLTKVPLERVVLRVKRLYEERPAAQP